MISKSCLILVVAALSSLAVANASPNPLPAPGELNAGDLFPRKVVQLSEQPTRVKRGVKIPAEKTTASKKKGGPITSKYSLASSSAGSTFFDNWDFFTSADPTHGNVNFLSQSAAQAAGLAYTTSTGTFVMKVDSTTSLASGQNRNSVRITSKVPVQKGSLILMDAVRMPYGPGVWPAFWTVGQDWPSNGEIDIVEGVHDQVQNQMTLHSATGCSLSTPMAASGTVLQTNCDVNVNYNAGCGVLDASSRTFGSGFNGAGGGVFATTFDNTGVSIWVFLRGSIPIDITNGNPNPANWGTPRAKWTTQSCNFSQFFGAQTMVFDITLCGDWAGNTYNQAGFSGTCAAAVENPANFVNAAFEVNYVKVFTAN